MPAGRLKSRPGPNADTPAMGALAWVVNDLGLVLLTILVSGLAGFLVYTMLHPERM